MLYLLVAHPHQNRVRHVRAIIKENPCTQVMAHCKKIIDFSGAVFWIALSGVCTNFEYLSVSKRGQFHFKLG